MKTINVDERIEKFRLKRKLNIKIAMILTIASLVFTAYSARHMIEELRKVDLTNLSPDSFHIMKAIGHFALGYSVLWIAISAIPSFLTKPYDALVFHLYDRIKSLEDKTKMEKSSEHPLSP